MSDRAWLEALWFGSSAAMRGARGALWPVEQVFRLTVAARNASYDRQLFRVVTPPITTISVGNLSVGGTGKTPFASLVASECAARGSRPAIILRSYGGDEQMVHEVLAPDVPVFANGGGDRLPSILGAAAAGCTVAIMDDGFQHRRIRRDLDIVLFSADRMASRCLPAGPLREPLSHLARADLVVVTRKAAGRAQVAEVLRIAGAASRTPPLVAEIQPAGLNTWPPGGPSLPLTVLKGARVLLIAGVGDPAAFRAQVEALGADATPALFKDHHRFSAQDALRLAEQGRTYDMIVCTLKDAVKLGALWPRGAEGFYYVSQRIVVTAGASELASRLDRLMPAVPL